MSSHSNHTESQETIRLRIEGMSCASCVSRVERALSQVEGVSNASVNLATESAAVETNSKAPSTKPLLEAVRAAGYDAHVLREADRALDDVEKSRNDRARAQQQAFVHSLGLAIPIVAIHWLAPTLQGSEPGGQVWPQAIQALLCSILLISAGGAPIMVGGLRALIHWTPNMDLLVSIGAAVAYVAGIVGLLGGFPDLSYFHATAMILALVNLGRTIETRVRHRAAGAITALTQRIPKTALLLDEGQVKTVPLDQIQIGDRIRIAQDGLIPIDGIVTDGQAAVDESSLTGEPISQHRSPGDNVSAGTLVTEGLLTVEAQRIGRSSRMGQIIRAVEEAQAGKTHLQRIADRVAGVFVPIVMILAVVTLLGNLSLADSTWGLSIRRSIAVVVIACPCAMGLATPMAIMVAVGSAATSGILIRDPAALERAAGVDCVLFDKTGTLTTGKPTVTVVTPIGNTGSVGTDELLRLAAAAEQYTQHPIAVAIVEEARRRGIDLPDADSFASTPGLGVVADIDSHTTVVGSKKHVQANGVSLTDAKPVMDTLAKRGETVVVVAVDGCVVGALALADSLRTTAVDAVKSLQTAGIDLSILSGDQEQPVQAIASVLGVSTYQAALTPEQKQDSVRQRIAEGHCVAFVGDGVNDAPALAAAQVGMAPAGGTDVAGGAADFSLLFDDLRLIPKTFFLAKRCVRIIKQNLFWAFLYNLIAIPLAATGHVSPGWAAGAMMFSSISVVLNSLRLRTSTEH